MRLLGGVAEWQARAGATWQSDGFDPEARPSLGPGSRACACELRRLESPAQCGRRDSRRTASAVKRIRWGGGRLRIGLASRHGRVGLWGWARVCLKHRARRLTEPRSAPRRLPFLRPFALSIDPRPRRKASLAARANAPAPSVSRGKSDTQTPFG